MRDEISRPQLGEIFAGRYLLTRLIGSGKASVVFAARHHVTGKRFAIRWFLPGLDPRKAKPSAIVGDFKHPNVLEVFDVGEHGGCLYAVLDWSEGESLDARVKRNGRLPVPEAIRLLVPCLRGVHEAHGAGIVHGDLKPANVFIFQGTRSTPEVAKVLDFQVEEQATVDGETNILATRPGPPMQYRAPEQLAGKKYDHRVDVYGFGALLHDVLSGAPRSQGAQLPAGAAEIIARATAPKPAERFQSLAELASALTALGKPTPQTVVTQHTQFVSGLPAPAPIRPRATKRQFVAEVIEPNEPANEPATPPAPEPVAASTAPPKRHFISMALAKVPITDPPSVYPTEVARGVYEYGAASPPRTGARRFYVAAVVAVVATLAYIANRDDTAVVTHIDAAAPPDGLGVELEPEAPSFELAPLPAPEVHTPSPVYVPPPAAVSGAPAIPDAEMQPVRLPLRPPSATPGMPPVTVKREPPPPRPRPTEAPRLQPPAQPPRARATRSTPEPEKVAPEERDAPHEPPDMQLL